MYIQIAICTLVFKVDYAFLSKKHANSNVGLANTEHFPACIKVIKQGKENNDNCDGKYFSFIQSDSAGFSPSFSKVLAVIIVFGVYCYESSYFINELYQRFSEFSIHFNLSGSI